MLFLEAFHRYLQGITIGLGVMGWAEMLIQLGIPYHSSEALQLAAMLMEFINRHSFEVSTHLTKERGTFPNWKKSVYAFKQLEVRNATRTSIAPTGSISILANTSSSIEPLFALAYQRQNILNDQTLLEVNQLFVEHLKSHHLFTDTLIEEIISSGNLKGRNSLPESTKNLFKTSLEIPYQTHLRHQQAFQQYTDNAVSKTINMPHEATPDDVASAYEMAWQLGVKGITVYRYGSKRKQVLSTATSEYPQVAHKVCKVCIE